MQLTITQEHVDAGIRECGFDISAHCPTAQALKAAEPGHWSVGCTEADLYSYSHVGGYQLLKKYRLSHELQMQIFEFGKRKFAPGVYEMEEVCS